MTVTVPVTVEENVIQFGSDGGEQGPPGEGVPAGGTANQVLSKIDDQDYNTYWNDPGEAINGIPSGGTADQIMVKLSVTDYDTEWQDVVSDVPDGGTVGQALTKIDGNDQNMQWSTVGDMRKDQNLSDVTNPKLSRRNLGTDDSYARNYINITGKVGSTATDLDSLTTLGATPDASVGNLIITRTGPGGSLNMWVLRAGNDAEDVAGGIIRPDDYATSTNEVVYEILL